MPPTENSTNVRFTVRLLRAGLGALARIDPSLAARALGRLFATPRRSPRPERERRWLADAVRRDISVRGQSLTLYAWGDERDPLVLLVHGWAGRGSQLGAFVEPLRQRGFRVVALDGPAHGDSPGRVTNLPEFRVALGEVLRQLRPDGVIAHSFGAAATTLAFAHDAPACPAVFVAPVHDATSFLSKAAAALGLCPEIANACRNQFEDALEVRWERLRAGRFTPWMETPLLVVHDEADAEVAFDDGRLYSATWPGAHLVPTRGLGHRRILRDPEVVQHASAFLAEQIAGDAEKGMAEAHGNRTHPGRRDRRPTTVLKTARGTSP